MTTRRRERVIYLQTAWMLVLVLFLALLGGSLEIFFVASLIGFLALVDLTAPVHVTPAWRRRIRWVIVVGLVYFGYIVLRESLEVLGVEVPVLF